MPATSDKEPTIRHGRTIAALALAGYSLALLHLEWRTSQDYVRNYFTDIKGEVFFHAVNTTLLAGMLAGSGLLFLFAAVHAVREQRQKWLFGGQALFCLWSAFDDRFSVHEATAGAFGTGDGYLMAGGVAIANAAWYQALFRPRDFNWRMAKLLVGAAAFYVVMLAFDTSLPDRMLWRLSVEDLCKSWASFLFPVLGWEALRFHSAGIPAGEQGLTIPARFMHLTPAYWRDEPAAQ